MHSSLRTRLVLLALVGGLSKPIASPAAYAPLTAEEASLAGEQLDELAGFMMQERLGLLQWPRLMLVGGRFMTWGPIGNNYFRTRFQQARDPYTALLAGVSVIVHGNDRHRLQLRHSLETDPRKQAWLRTHFGSLDAARALTEEGQSWQKLTVLLPSTEGTDRFALLCLQSADPLVRRLGLWWGSWTASPQYTLQTATASARDPDPVTLASRTV